MNTIVRREAPFIALAVALAALAVVAAMHLPGGGRNARPSAGLSALTVTPADERSEVMQQRIKAKERVLTQLVTEELTLPQAAAWFRFLNDNPAGCTNDFRRHCRGGSDGEKACRQVVAWLGPHLRLRMPPSQADALLHRYEAELDTLLAAGPVELPW